MLQNYYQQLRESAANFRVVNDLPDYIQSIMSKFLLLVSLIMMTHHQFQIIIVTVYCTALALFLYFLFEHAYSNLLVLTVNFKHDNQIHLQQCNFILQENHI
jgi:hypothetical protein